MENDTAPSLSFGSISLPGTLKSLAPRPITWVKARPGLASDAHEVFELTRQERVEPSTHQHHRRLKRSAAVLAVDVLPVGVANDVRGPIVEEGDVADRSVVGFSGRSAAEPALEWLGGWRDILGASAPNRPEERTGERERAARVKHAEEVGARDLDHERRSAVWRCRHTIGNGPLGVTECRATPHPQPTVEPRLAVQPVERLETVLPFAYERRVLTARLVSTARALNDRGVAAFSPEAAHCRCDQ